MSQSRTCPKRSQCEERVQSRQKAGLPTGTKEQWKVRNQIHPTVEGLEVKA